MITPQYVQRMSRYNRWQNESIYAAAGSLSDPERRLDRGSFFKSIHATLSHILWADQIWMSRLSDWEKPDTPITGSGDYIDDWQTLSTRRRKADATFIDWAVTLTDTDTAGDLSWYSGAMQRDLVRPKAVCMMQVFNHQTHHRGQVHAMLTAAGAAPEDTDIPFMPEAYL